MTPTGERDGWEKAGSFPMRNTRCSNCGTERFRVHAKNLCRRCYDLVLRVSRIQAWNASDLTTLKGFPTSLPLPKPEDVAKLRADVIDQLRKRLQDLRRAEQSLAGPASSVRIEFQLQRLAKRAGARNAASITHGLASVFDDFGPKHRTTLHGILHSIEENIPWPGIRWSGYLET